MTNRLTKKQPTRISQFHLLTARLSPIFALFGGPDILWHVSKVSNYMTTFCPVFIILSASVFFSVVCSYVNSNQDSSCNIIFYLSLSFSPCICVLLSKERVRGLIFDFFSRFFILLFLPLSVYKYAGLYIKSVL